MKLSVEQCAFIVGGLLLEQAPKLLLLNEAQLEEYYAPALQNFIDYMKADYNLDFEAPADFKNQVMGHVFKYLDRKHAQRAGLPI